MIIGIYHCPECGRRRLYKDNVICKDDVSEEEALALVLAGHKHVDGLCLKCFEERIAAGDIYTG
jgi:hypothetical protein